MLRIIPMAISREHAKRQTGKPKWACLWRQYHKTTKTKARRQRNEHISRGNSRQSKTNKFKDLELFLRPFFATVPEKKNPENQNEHISWGSPNKFKSTKIHKPRNLHIFRGSADKHKDAELFQRQFLAYVSAYGFSTFLDGLEMLYFGLFWDWLKEYAHTNAHGVWNFCFCGFWDRLKEYAHTKAHGVWNFCFCGLPREVCSFQFSWGFWNLCVSCFCLVLSREICSCQVSGIFWSLRLFWFLWDCLEEHAHVLAYGVRDFDFSRLPSKWFFSFSLARSFWMYVYLLQHIHIETHACRCTPYTHKHRIDVYYWTDPCASTTASGRHFTRVSCFAGGPWRQEGQSSRTCGHSCRFNNIKKIAEDAVHEPVVVVVTTDYCTDFTIFGLALCLLYSSLHTLYMQ